MDPTSSSSNPVLTKSKEAATTTASALGSEAKPETVLAEIRSLLGEGRYRAAQRLVKAAVARFPEHSGVGKMHYALHHRQVRTRPTTGRDTTEDYGWLKDPPEAVRGKWVALAGNEVLATADRLTDLTKSLRPEDLTRKPLLVHVD